MSKRQRLVVCLDGTWNQQDSGTNVLHHYAMALKGAVSNPDGSMTHQLKYYHKGVGTGVLDGITGGGFGFGIEETVRDAYNWLVRHYHEGDTSAEADEIYIFGFSRGAYTARSLVGFIATCGLLRRGAPLSVDEMWSNYGILGRQRERRNSFWDSLFGKPPTNFRRITDLVCDPWKVEEYETWRRSSEALTPPVANDNSGRIPGQLVERLTHAEKLLVRWSRRARITYLGVYDTVGALGIDALAIPGLKSKLATHHNMRATTLVQHCRHALALDEHRSSFSQTPLLEYVDHRLVEEGGQGKAMQKVTSGTIRSSATPEEKAKEYWNRKSEMWQEIIEQRWFIGAHSNVGGGYPDNELAQKPLEWLLEGASAAGLQSETFNYLPPIPAPPPRDSYAEFAKPFWTQIIRGKRFYRVVDPERRYRANAASSSGETRSNGYSLQSINETIDPSVFQYVETCETYRPLNLVEYAARKMRASPLPTNSVALQAIIDRTPAHTWLGKTASAYLILVLWATFGGFGLAAVNWVIRVLDAKDLPLLSLAAVALSLVLVDWSESRANYSLALDVLSPRKRAWLDTLYWFRSLGFMLFVVGVLASLVYASVTGWSADNMQAAWGNAVGMMQQWWLVPLAAAAGIGIANFIDRAPKEQQIWGLVGAVAGAALAPVGVVLIVLLSRLFGTVFTPIFGHGYPHFHQPEAMARQAGILLILEFGCGCLFNSFNWVNEPMATANLGWIARLQWCCTSHQVSSCLESWRKQLLCSWDVEDNNNLSGPAATTMHQTLRETLWRNIFGYIPVRSFVLGLGLWIAAKQLLWSWIGLNLVGIPVWLGLPLLTAAAGYSEAFCNLRYVNLHSQGKVPSNWLSLLGFAMTLVKSCMESLSIILTFFVIVIGSLNLSDTDNSSGWRGTLVLLIGAIAALALVTLLASIAVYESKAWWKKRQNTTEMAQAPTA